MSSTSITWIKKQFEYLIDSLPEILKAILLVSLVTSGLGVAILVRFLDYNGIIISISGIIVEVFALILCYVIFREYLKPTEEEKAKDSKRGKKL